MTAVTSEVVLTGTSAVLDDAHVGDIHGALGTIRLGDIADRGTLTARLKTLLAVVGPGLIVMVGDNDAGAFSTYGQAGQNYGTKLLWTLLLLVPVLYVNQEMVLRLGAVTGVGHARLIMSRFGRLWGAFEITDLFILNALTIITEFIGITLAAAYLGLPKILAVVLAAAVIISTAFTGSFRRFEQIAMAFCAGSLLLIPLYLLSHPSGAQMARGFTTPALPAATIASGATAPAGDMAAVMLLVIGIVGTTIAPWQLFFQQSYVIDKRITPRFMRYEKADLWIGIAVVIGGAAAIIGATAAAFAGTRGAGSFTDAAGIARGLAAASGHVAGALFAVALLDASVIGAFAVSLSSAYAIGDVLGMKHSLHRGVGQAKGFYALYAALICGAAAVVLIPGSPLGLITEGVQVLAGVLLPAATVFLLMLCNDRAVLGPWVNGRKTNAFTGAVITVLITLSVVLTASVLDPAISAAQIAVIMGVCAGLAISAGAALTIKSTIRNAPAVPLAAQAGSADGQAYSRWRQPAHRGIPGGSSPRDSTGRLNWRMPPLSQLPAPVITGGRKWALAALRVYLAVAMTGVIVKIVLLAVH